MTYLENPFTPSFGEVPDHLAGRHDIVRRFDRAFSARLRRPELTTILTGARGTGKTTLLSCIARRAESSGWVCAEVTCGEGMLDDIEIRSRHAAAHLVPSLDRVRITSVGVSDVASVGFEFVPDKDNWRRRMELILDDLDKTETGLLITVDEVNGSLDEMIRLATVYQHFVREGRKVSLVMAGLPHNVSSLIKDKTVSFLRRAQRETLGRIDDFEVRDALKKTIEENGRTIGGSGLERAVEAVDGFPFMLQLVGYRIWDESIESQAISDDDVERGIAAARSEMESRILGATYNELSDGDIAYVNAMLEDEGDSKTGDVAARLGVSTSLAAQYRRRLIDAGVIGGRKRGVVGFDLPYFREFLERRR